MDDNLADYRRFCANRLKRLERCKKTKSFCNLDDNEVPISSSGTKSKADYNESAKFLFNPNDSTTSQHSSTVAHSAQTISVCLESRRPSSISCTEVNMNSNCLESSNFSFLNKTVRSKSEIACRKSSDIMHLQDKSTLLKSMTSTLVQTEDNIDNDQYLLSTSCSASTSSGLPSSEPSKPYLNDSVPMINSSVIVLNNIDNNNDDDSSLKAQKKFDLLREKMVIILSFFFLPIKKI
ncbi:unnamed protein product [Thelazia callipaeda]|uniref:Uncharacterized protein n=1 Tax=Thelazia callipaeda TaxID=103827 RepID=A0A0N5CWJ3_THECL|nr:unnamed protein product [Thelazia callipaeda]